MVNRSIYYQASVSANPEIFHCKIHNVLMMQWDGNTLHCQVCTGDIRFTDKRARFGKSRRSIRGKSYSSVAYNG